MWKLALQVPRRPNESHEWRFVRPKDDLTSDEVTGSNCWVLLIPDIGRSKYSRTTVEKQHLFFRCNELCPDLMKIQLSVV